MKLKNLGKIKNSYEKVRDSVREVEIKGGTEYDVAYVYVKSGAKNFVLEYADEEGYLVFKAEKKGDVYRVTEFDDYHLIDSPFDAIEGIFKNGDIVSEEILNRYINKAESVAEDLSEYLSEDFDED